EAGEQEQCDESEHHRGQYTAGRRTGGAVVESAGDDEYRRGQSHRDEGVERDLPAADAVGEFAAEGTRDRSEERTDEGDLCGVQCRLGGGVAAGEEVD